MNSHRRRSLFSFIFLPSAFAVILFGIFSMVWLRSSVRAMEYTISSLDNKRMEMIKEKKMLMADRSGILSIQNVRAGGEKTDLVFPDRVKVVYVKKGDSSGVLKASLNRRNVAGP